MKCSLHFFLHHFDLAIFLNRETCVPRKFHVIRYLRAVSCPYSPLCCNWLEILWSQCMNYEGLNITYMYHCNTSISEKCVDQRETVTKVLIHVVCVTLILRLVNFSWNVFFFFPSWVLSIFLGRGVLLGLWLIPLYQPMLSCIWWPYSRVDEKILTLPGLKYSAGTFILSQLCCL